MGLDRVKWLANEGIRVAAIVGFLEKQSLTNSQKALLAPALDPAPRPAKPLGAALRADPVSAGESGDPTPPAVGPAEDVGAERAAEPLGGATRPILGPIDVGRGHFDVDGGRQRGRHDPPAESPPA